MSECYVFSGNALFKLNRTPFIVVAKNATQAMKLLNKIKVRVSYKQVLEFSKTTQARGPKQFRDLVPGVYKMTNGEVDFFDESACKKQKYLM